MPAVAPVVLTARDVMTRRLITFRAHVPIDVAMRTLVRKGISGAPVVDDSGAMIGMLSEYDCLKVLAGDRMAQLFEGPAGNVGDYMTTGFHTVGPDVDLPTVANTFLTRRVRRLPVIEGNRLIGQVSRRDVLKGIQRMRASTRPREYPDYRRPA